MYAISREQQIENDELLQEVDQNDKNVGGLPRIIAHSGPKRYHRAAWIFLFNSKENIVLQQRSKHKINSPEMWDMVGGHQKYGEMIEETASNELWEEMGIKTNLVLFVKSLLQNEKQSEFHYIYYGFHDGPYKYDPDEVATVRAFDCQKLLNHEYDSEYPILTHVYEQLEILRSVWQK